MMELYNVKLIGTSALLMHRDDVEWRDQLGKFRKDPANKKSGVAGDDRSPPWTWVGYMYHDGVNVGIESDLIMACIREGASKLTIKGNKTFKSQSQSGILVNEILWPLVNSKGVVPWAPFSAMIGVNDFEAQKKSALDHGFELFVKPGVVAGKKHIRVRPRFNTWSIQGSMTVFDDMITQEVLDSIFFQAGNYCGLGDWRPNSKKSGSFGKFRAEITKQKE